MHQYILFSFMNACTQTRRACPNKKATIGMFLAMLLKNAYSKVCLVCLVQKIIASIGRMHLLFKNSIKEGDGKRVLQCCCCFLPVFVNSGHRNYANESLNLLCQ